MQIESALFFCFVERKYLWGSQTYLKTMIKQKVFCFFGIDRLL